MQYHAACSLGSLLQRLYQHVPTERVLHVPLEWMHEDPAREYRRVLSYLEVEDDGRDTFPPANEARGHRSRFLQRLIRCGGEVRMALGIKKGYGLARLNDKPQPKEELSTTFREELESAFSQERNKLKTMMESQA